MLCLHGIFLGMFTYTLVYECSPKTKSLTKLNKKQTHGPRSMIQVNFNNFINYLF